MSMVSIGEELRGQHLRQILDALLLAYASTFDDLRRFAVEWDASVTEEYRTALSGLASKAGTACQSGSRLSEFQVAVRKTLEAYKRRAEAYLAGLQGKLSDSAEALARLVSSLATGQQHHDQELDNALADLRRTAGFADIVEVRRHLVGLTATFTECVASIRRQNSLVVAQLTDEINLLHRQIEHLQSVGKSGSEDGPSVCSTAGLPASVEDLIVSDQPFSLLLVRVQNLDVIRSKDGLAGAAEVAGYCLRRMTDLKMPISQIGVWSDNVLAALLAVDYGPLNVGHMITGHLGGVHSIPIDGIPRQFDLRVSTALLKRPSAEARDRTYQRLAALLQALG